MPAGAVGIAPGGDLQVRSLLLQYNESPSYSMYYQCTMLEHDAV